MAHDARAAAASASHDLRDDPRAAPGSTASSARSTSSGISRNEQRPARKAATASSSAAFSAHGARPPASPAARASARQRNVSSVGRLERQREARGQVEPRRARSAARGRDRRARRRSAPACPGRPRCASSAPSRQAHERVHDRLRLHDDLDAVVRHAEQQVRLDHLEALVHQRGGVDRDARAHRPGRVRSASSTETSASSARERPRNGPPEAVSDERLDRRRPTRRAAAGAAPSARSRRGSAPRRCARAAASTSGPPATRLSLFASATSMPGLERGERRAEPGDARRTRSARGRPHDLGRERGDAVGHPRARGLRSPSARAPQPRDRRARSCRTPCSRASSPSSRSPLPAASATTSTSGRASTTSRA